MENSRFSHKNIAAGKRHRVRFSFEPAIRHFERSQIFVTREGGTLYYTRRGREEKRPRVLYIQGDRWLYYHIIIYGRKVLT